MPKGALEERVETNITALRDDIRDLELGMTSLKGRRDDVIRLLELRDAIENELQKREDAGQDVRAERSRVDTIDNQLRRQAPDIMHELGRSGGLDAARQSRSPSGDQWWWWMDLTVIEQRKRSAKRSAILIITVLVVVLGGGTLINHFWGPEPAEREASGLTSQGEQLLYQGEWQSAVPLYEQALITWPDDDTRIQLAVLYELQGEQDKADELFAEAKASVNNPNRFLLFQCRAYQAVGELDKALAKVEMVLENAPNMAEAVFMRGSVHEAMGESQQAIVDFETAADLAAENGEDALYVMARTRMGMLMQSAPVQGLAGY